MTKCGYKNKGCMSADTCNKEYKNCGIAKYFDFLVLNSPEAKENMLPPQTYVEVFRNKQPIVNQCKLEKGCSRIDEFGFCTIFPFPSKRWPAGEASWFNKCLQADHIKFEKAKKGHLNPIKASKRKLF